MSGGVISPTWSGGNPVNERFRLTGRSTQGAFKMSAEVLQRLRSRQDVNDAAHPQSPGNSSAGADQGKNS